MAYIGTPVQQALTKVTSQSFNGTGSQTVFTLNRAVNTGEELEVFVNNVQQEPGVGKSYTATGTTLTFDAAPASGTGNIYVIYRGIAEVTRRLEHDPNAALAATTGTFSDGITVDKNGATVATFDRATSDGSIVDFQKSGTTVGSIASRANVVSSIILDPRSGGGGLTGGGAALYPTDNAGATSDGVLTLGDASARFNNLYLSGGVYLGGTGAANLLDDYEEGTWNVTIVNGSLTPTVTSASYTKIGNRVFLSCQLVVPTNSEGNYMALGGLPFATSGDSAGSLAYTTATTSNSIGLLVQSSTIYFYKDGSAYATSEFSNKQVRLSAQYET